MTLEKNLKNYLFDHFNDCVAGRLTKGIVHNLNGPIQILSMQVELFRLGLSQNMSVLEKAGPVEGDGSIQGNLRKGLGDLVSRLDQMEEALQRIEQNVRIIGNRGGDAKENEIRPLILATLLQEELEFWKGDLFFKHQVELTVDMPEDPPIVHASENALRDLVDGIMGACVEHLKAPVQKRSLVISLSGLDDGSMAFRFSQSGPSFPSLEDVPETHGGQTPDVSLPDGTFSALSLILAREKASSMEWGFDVAGSDVTVLIKFPHSM